MPGPYPPALTGLRGSHPGSFEPAHALAMQGRQDWGRVASSDDDLYDLVVIGAGLSGLSAAWFFQEQRPDARKLISYGGSQSIDTPRGYSRVRSVSQSKPIS